MKMNMFVFTLAFTSSLMLSAANNITVIVQPVKLTLDKDLERGSVAIEGEAARYLYDNLNVATLELEDRNDSRAIQYRKVGQNYVCTYDSSGHHCSINIIDISNGKVWSSKK